MARTLLQLLPLILWFCLLYPCQSTATIEPRGPRRIRLGSIEWLKPEESSCSWRSVLSLRDRLLTQPPTWITHPPQIVLTVSKLYRHNYRSLLCLSAAAIVLRTVSSEPFSRATYFWRRAGPMVAHYRWTQLLLAVTKADRPRRDAVYAQLHRRYAPQALEIALHLQGLYVKIGQVLSARPDFMPPDYTRLLATLQDSIPPWPIHHVKNIVAESMRRELGLEMEDVFVDIEHKALGSASIGQVHAATLHNTWSDQYGGPSQVAIKVMHPGCQERFQHDFAVFRWLCRVALPGWKRLLVELERQIMTEFDYTREAANLQHVRENLAKSEFAKRIVIPEPHMGLTTKHVLVMELLHGRPMEEMVTGELTKILGEHQAQTLLGKRKMQIMGTAEQSDSDDYEILSKTSPLTKFKLFSLQRSIAKYVDWLVDFHGQQIFIDGVWNGDPHPGNCLILHDGRLGLLDYGQTKRMQDDHERRAFSQVVVALGSNAADTIVSDAMQKAGFSLRDNADTKTMAQYAVLFFDSDHESQNQGFPTPQQYFASLMLKNALVRIPDSSTRTSFLFRGLGNVIGRPMHTAQRWYTYALEALTLSG